MASLQSFRSLVMPSVNGCPIPIADQAILNACIDFCERSLIFREVLETCYTAVNSTDVELDLPTQTRVAKIMRVSLDEVEIRPVGSDDFMGININPNTPSAKPSSFAYMPSGVLSFFPVPNAVYRVQAYVALKPSRSATAVDDRLFEDWGDYIASGALQRLLSIPSEWGNLSLAKMHYDIYTSGVNKALVESRREKTRAEERIQPVWI